MTVKCNSCHAENVTVIGLRSLRVPEVIKALDVPTHVVARAASGNSDFQERGDLTAGTLNDSDCFKIVDTRNLADVSGRLNAELFDNTHWEDTTESKARRNKSHWEKSQTCLMLIRNLVRGSVPNEKNKKWIGFTHILPLTQDGWSLYISGKLKDKDFPSDFVAGRDDTPRGFLFFSVGFDFAYMQKIHAENWRQRFDVTTFLQRAVVYHLRAITQQPQCLRLSKIELLEQVPEVKNMLSLTAHLRLRKYGALESADGCPLYYGDVRSLLE